MTFWQKVVAWLESLFAPQKTLNEKILETAMAELGQKEVRGGENPRIIEYHAATTGKFDEDEVAWCSSFVCWVLQQCGVTQTRNALAMSYKTWGVPVAGLSNALPGDVIVRSRGKDSKGNTLHHVHFLAEKHLGGSTYKAVGGNQSDAVTINESSVSGILTIRRAPNGEAKTAAPAQSSGGFKTLFPKQDWAEYALEVVKESNLTAVEVRDTWFNNTAENWVHLLAAMCKYESNFKPESTFKESFKNSKGEYVVSTGLLQLSYESVGGYGFKVTTEQLKDPKLNIKIALKILETWVVKDHAIAATGSVPYKGGSRYWSVLRAKGKLSSVKSLYAQWAK